MKIVLLKTNTSWVSSTGKETSSRICSKGFFLLVSHALSEGGLALKGVKSQKVFKNGRQFLLFLADLFAFINSVWAL